MENGEAEVGRDGELDDGECGVGRGGGGIEVRVGALERGAVGEDGKDSRAGGVQEAADGEEERGRRVGTADYDEVGWRDADS